MRGKRPIYIPSGSTPRSLKLYDVDRKAQRAWKAQYPRWKTDASPFVSSPEEALHWVVGQFPISPLLRSPENTPLIRCRTTKTRRRHLIHAHAVIKQLVRSFDRESSLDKSE